MQELSRLGMMVLIGVFGVGALFAAAKAQDGVPYWVGIAFFVFCILLLFKLIAEHDKHAH
jgi:arginine exporter protein ArgO